MALIQNVTVMNSTATVKAKAVNSSGGSFVDIDTALSATSENPVQNKAITGAVNGLATRVSAVESTVGGLASGAPTPAATVAQMVDTGKIYLYTGTESGYTAGDWYYYDGTEWVSGGTYGGLANGSVTGKKLSASIRNALKQIFQHVAYADDNGQEYYNALVSALNSDAIVTNVSAVYTQSGAVYDADSLDSLKADLVVTANYSDGTSEVVTDYELSGELTEGTSVITVEYEDVTTTFNVTVTAVVYLYKDGDECTALTGGYSKKGFIANDSRITYGNDGTCLSFVLSSTASSQTAGTLTSANKIDLTNYSSICYEIESFRSVATSANMWAYFSNTVTNATANTAFGSPYTRHFLGKADGVPSGRITIEKETDSEFTGERYVSFLINAWGNLAANGCYLKVHKVYLKPKVNA